MHTTPRTPRTASLAAALTLCTSLAPLLAPAQATAADPVAAPTPVATAPAGNAAQAEKRVRGAYLTTVAGCNDCHTPLKMGANGPEPDMGRMLSGHPQDLVLPPAPALPAAGPWNATIAATNTAWSGPWGTSFTANLTPDRDTGLGKWTLRNFIETIRTGRHLGRGREILPPMPYPMYKHFTDADLEAIYVYLQSIPALRNQVPEPLPPTATAGQ